MSCKGKKKEAILKPFSPAVSCRSPVFAGYLPETPFRVAGQDVSGCLRERELAPVPEQYPVCCRWKLRALRFPLLSVKGFSGCLPASA